MGAEYFSEVARGDNPQKLFKALVDDAQYEYGHSGYSGSIAEKGEFDLNDEAPPFTNFQEASDWAYEDAHKETNDDYYGKWGPALAVVVVDPQDSSKILGYVFYGWAPS